MKDPDIFSNTPWKYFDWCYSGEFCCVYDTDDNTLADDIPESLAMAFSAVPDLYKALYTMTEYLQGFNPCDYTKEEIIRKAEDAMEKAVGREVD